MDSTPGLPLPDTSRTIVVDPLTRENQRRAADPRASAWVSANAGAGKTKVLTDRVVRLLLDGSPPGRILCLTFTKAAAANMAIRVFQRLGRWVTLDDDALAAELTELTGERPNRDRLRMARRLFARAVETPGGLKIETLHALCERLLHMFPFEANVPARFVVLDETQAREMFAVETANVLADATLAAGTPAGVALARVTAEATGDALHDAVRAAVRAHALLAHGNGFDGAFDRLRGELGLAAGETIERIEAAILDEGPEDLAALAAALQTGKANDVTLSEALAEASLAREASRGRADRSDALDVYKAVFFTQKDEPKADKSLGTKSIPEPVKLALIAERNRLVPLFDRLRAARAHARTEALFTLAAEIHRRVEAQKARLGALDFDDLIRRALDLLSRVGAGWVLYKLDRGIDHVLVDEAQDTNPEQWAILRTLTQEFAAGAGARDAHRTRFAVGDPKQSIYGFQGADPREFAVTRSTWITESRAAGIAFADVPLTLSFRSTTMVLRAVDSVFAIEAHNDGLSEDEVRRTVHASARPRAAGAVEVWDIAEPEPADEVSAWTAPVDLPDPGAPALRVARRVAAAVKTWIHEGDATGRVWRPGDILILVRKRGPAFEEVIRSLKGLGVPVAGQDRLEVSAHIAVADLVSVGRAGLLPADDLTLATALKTPLVGLTDDDLVRLAAGRPDEETLQDALARHAEAGDATAVRALDALATWIELAGALGPFGFYARLLGPMEGRAKLVSRLGGEAGDAIDVFLAAAAHAEGGEDAPSLGGFLARYLGTEAGHTVKRDLESGRDEIRVMTVHGSKGLEAPVVVILDGCEAPGGKDPPLLPMIGRKATLPPVWTSTTQDCAATGQVRAALGARSRQEHNRLLYVAMTRAADRLVVAPFRGKIRETEAAWCRMIRLGLETALGEGESVEMPYGPAVLWRDGLVSGREAPARPPAEGPPDAPTWLRSPVAPEVAAVAPLHPSGMLDAADGTRLPPPRLADPTARRRGLLVHALLQHLPRLERSSRQKAGLAYLVSRAPGLGEPALRGILGAVMRLLDHPALAPLFAEGALAEVNLSGRVSVGGTERPVTGRVDRLAVAEGTVTLADFKTGRPPDDGAPLPEAESSQIALYARLLARIYPDKRIVPMLVWTSSPVIRILDEAAVEAALGKVGIDR
ncbi:double-strand break repair helicase AddA [Methylobacterium persicinum]|uniref:DNA 3'-5' helicase n=1 Tax=Methylobacterium persicinum TaxID=374426 RepID=A0ABU0HTA4_9HYPH|nr:double-strand break repair helicase AddA [Methylobacterium persicinum]MDQ0444716.1 ATP-dependent helicase/nuclease subunit A [Methylobacterium persicinum]GJE39726.1 RecBCD enzyme subunit RecB [Methylobacterium persicinum]